jgi:hypothetical protein
VTHPIVVRIQHNIPKLGKFVGIYNTLYRVVLS